MNVVVHGTTKTGRPRDLEMRRDGERVYLWIHAPDDREGGLEIYVDAENLRRALGEGEIDLVPRAPAERGKRQGGWDLEL